MGKSLLLAGYLLAFSGMVQAETDRCPERRCLVPVQFASDSDSRSYGLLISAPEAGCKRVRFRVVKGRAILGQSPPLGPGDLAVIRLGAGFHEGQVDIVVEVIGCRSEPAEIRRVTLAKLSPDHGWRASRVLALR